jgi:hypothetical protein
MAPVFNLQASAGERLIEITLENWTPDIPGRLGRVTDLDRLTQGIFAFETDDRPDIFTRVTVAKEVVLPIAGAEETFMATGEIGVSLTLRAVDGVSLSKQAMYVHVLNATPTRLPVGTGTVAPISIHQGAWGAGATRVLTYFSPTGIPYRVLTLTAPTGQSLAANDHLEVDHNNRTITKVTAAGVRSNAGNWKASGDFLRGDPVDQIATTLNPYVTIDGGAQLIYVQTHLV